MAASIQFSFDYHPHDSAPTILFLHGFMGSKADWSEIAKNLQDGFGTLAVDLPGHGQTETTSEADYEMSLCATNLIELIDQLESKPLNLIGYSMGGRLGWYLLLKFPDKFKAALIESASPGLIEASERRERVDLDDLLAQKLLRCDFADFVGGWYSQPLFESLSADQSKLDQLIARRMANNPQKLALSMQLMGTGSQPNLWPELAQLKIPTLLLAGEYDQKYSNLVRQISDLCPRASGSIIEKAGHNIHFEQPAEFIRQANQFLHQHG